VTKNTRRLLPMTWRGSLWPLSQLKVLRTKFAGRRPEILQRLDIRILVAFATRADMMIIRRCLCSMGCKCGGAVEFSGSKALGTLQVLLANDFSAHVRNFKSGVDLQPEAGISGEFLALLGFEL